ncbi:MAG TPA: hypothetical protein VFT93_00670, partial [Candidatus Eisenbacteria bacterium]|nr:hypothetical protein [Candidatus Eisenbacteria bacterium]
MDPTATLPERRTQPGRPRAPLVPLVPEEPDPDVSPAPAPIEREDASAAPILQTKRLSLFYGSHAALKGVDLEIGQNRITAIIGPSGCG